MEKELREIFDKNNVGFGKIDIDNIVNDILRLISDSNSSNNDYRRGYRDGYNDCSKIHKEFEKYYC